jgi:hypothetical protein
VFHLVLLQDHLEFQLLTIHLNYLYLLFRGNKSNSLRIKKQKFLQSYKNLNHILEVKINLDRDPLKDLNNYTILIQNSYYFSY